MTGCGSSDPTTGGTSPERAQVAATSSAKVVAVGDIACPPGWRVTRKQCRHRKTAKAAIALSPNRVIALGDLQYQKGRFRAFKRSYGKSWGRLRPITDPVPGNHEYYTRGARGYYRYFRNRQPGPPGWYRRELNGWQLYLLNSNCKKVDCRAQKAWLRAEMAANPATCSLIAMHAPRFSSGQHGGTKRMQGFWRIAYEHHTDIALAGHDHNYERFAPLSPAGAIEPTRGIQGFVSGAGGKSLYPRKSAAPGSQRFIAKFGILELTLRPDSYSWRFLGPRLGVRDSGSASCR